VSAPAAARTAAVRRSRPRVGSYVLVAVLLVFYLFPLLFLLNTALKTNAEFNSDPVGIATSPAWGNFIQAWQQGDFGRFILNSLLYTITASVIGTFISVALAFPISRGYLKGSKYWGFLFVIVLFLPNALITQFQLLLRLHLYGTQIGYILIVCAGVGVGPLLMNGFVKSIPVEIDEAAAMDGAGYWRYLWNFVVPLARPAIVTVFILQAIWVWNEIILATVLLPDQTMSPITLGLFRFQGTYSNQWGLLAAATLIVAMPLIIAYVLLQRFIVNGVVGGVKG
jgi:raffinose/stachyose/melibiose transport system permease protein